MSFGDFVTVKYVCLSCRRVARTRRNKGWWRSCPECGEPMEYMGSDFRAPRRTDDRGWRKLRERAVEAQRLDELRSYCSHIGRYAGYAPSRVEDVGQVCYGAQWRAFRGMWKRH